MKRNRLHWLSRALFPIILLFLCGSVFAQDFSYQRYKETKARYSIPARELLQNAQKDLGITITWDKKAEPFLNEKIPMAPWKYWDNPELRLAYILAPLDLSFEKTGEKSYRVFEPWYYTRPEAEGKAHLDRLLKHYPDKNSWELRKADLAKNILKTLELDPLPQRTPLNPKVFNKRNYDGYSVSNVTLEIIPGYYLCGNLYEPLESKGLRPIVLCPHGHGITGRFSENHQSYGAVLARMGAVSFGYSMFAWIAEESKLDKSAHRDPFSGTMQTWTTMRVIDFLTSLTNVDTKKIGITGESGGGTQTFLGTALDPRITVAVPVVMVSSHFFGGCPCESGIPFHILCGGTCNAEIAAMAAPRPMKMIAVTQDWTKNMASVEFPYVKSIYARYGAEKNVEYEIFDEPHNYGPSKRKAMYPFMAKHLGLDISKADESKITIEPTEIMLGFGKDLKNYPANGVKNIEEVKKSFEKCKSK